jgi:hypothetical protein
VYLVRGELDLTGNLSAKTIKKAEVHHPFGGGEDYDYG